MILGIKKLHEDATIPEYQTRGAAGFDFHALEDVTTIAGGTYLIRTGLLIEIPENYEIQIRPRSGLSYKTGLRIVNSPGTIDSDYVGEIKIVIQNTAKDPYIIKKGDRIAQGVLNKVTRCEFCQVEDVKVTDRGDKGFNSTGV